MARQPRNGFGSVGNPPTGSLSPPMSKVRMTTGCAAERLDDAPVRAVLLVLVGHRRAADDEELGAHQADALGAAARGELGLLGEIDVRAQRDRARRRVVTASSAASSARARFGDCLLALRARGTPRSPASVGLIASMPVEPSRTTRLAARAAPASPCAGRRRPASPSERARIATCDVRVPASVAMRGDRLAVELHREARRQVVRDENRVRARRQVDRIVVGKIEQQREHADVRRR